MNFLHVLSIHPNPVGIGIVDEDRFREQREWPAPQIEDADQPIRNVKDRLAPAGLGPISPFWEDRLSRAGTYDDVWLKERHPLLPTDFDFSFWQAAPTGLVSQTHFIGDEEFELDHLLPGREVLRGRLPDIKLQIDIDQGNGPLRGPMVLDGVHFDLRPGVGRVFLTWRCGFPWRERTGLPKMSIVDMPEGVA